MKVRSLPKTAIAGMLGLLLAINANAARAEFETENGWSGQLFSSFIIATAAVRLPEDEEADEESEVLGDPQGLLGITVEADEDEQPIKVTIAGDALMEPSVYAGTLPEAGETYTIRPKIKYKYDRLAKCSQTGPVTVTYTVEIGEEEAEEKTETLVLHPSTIARSPWCRMTRNATCRTCSQPTSTSSIRSSTRSFARL